MAFDRSDYLSHFPGFYLTAYCALCKREANYGTDDIRAKQGGYNIVGLKTTIAEIWGCKRLLNLNWDRYRLEVRMAGGSRDLDASPDHTPAYRGLEG